MSTSVKKTLFLIVLSLISFFVWNRHVFQYLSLQSDNGYYDRVAVNVLSGNGFIDKGEYQGYTLGYESFLVSVFSVFGHSINAVRFVQGILFVCIVLLIHYFCSRFYSKKTGFIAGIFSAVFYVLPLSAGVIGKESLATFLILMFFYYFLKWRNSNSIPDALFSGFFLGAIVLTLAIAKFIFIPFFLLVIFVERKKIFKKSFVFSLSLLFLAYLVTVSPSYILSLRYQSSLGLSDQGGGLSAKAEQMENVYHEYPGHFIGISLGYYFSEKMYPKIALDAFRAVPKTDAAIDSFVRMGYPEYKYQKILFDRGLNSILRSPHKYVLMSLLDLISLNSPLVPHGQYSDLTFVHLTFAENRHDSIPDFVRAGYLLLIRGSWYLFLASSLYGMVLLWRRNKESLVFLLLFIFYFNATYALVHAIPRYAIPLYPIYIILAFGGLSVLLSKFYEKISDLSSRV